MTTMLERAARAVGNAVGYSGDDVLDKDSLAFDIARAVLMAVREIDKPLWLAGMYGTNGLRNEITPETVSASHTAIIDAILQEEGDQ